MGFRFSQAITIVLGKYVDFAGRASRSEYWYWFLFVFLASIAASIVDRILFGSSSSILSLVVTLGLFMPGLAVTVRRLHDIENSGWWLLIALIPIIGAIILLVKVCLPGTPGLNRFGSQAA